MIDPTAARIVATFNRCFAVSHRTVMSAGGDEPLYRPGTGSQCAQIIFNRDYPASALHEAAHWCIASASRRAQLDYGYTYAPPPRTAAQQAQFLSLEANNQGLEALFTAAIGMPFRASLDDLAAPDCQRARFERSVTDCAQRYSVRGLPARAARFERALIEEFGRG